MEGDIQVMSTLKSGREPPSEPLMLFGEEYYCEGLANDPEVEEFAELASEGLPNCVVATLLPWSVGHAPKGVLAPELESSDFLVPEAHIAKAVSGANTVLIPCTLEIEEEHEQAKRIIPQFARCDNIGLSAVCIIGVLLLPKLTQLNRETNQIVLRRHNELLAAGVDDVLFEHEWDLVTLKRAVNLSRAMWEMNILRTRLMLNAEIDYDVAEDASRCQEEHSDLLFQIPDALMPEFRSVDRHIIETGNSVGNFRLISMLSCKKGTVLQAVDEDQQAVAIKVFNKSQMVDPGVLESIYREYRFMGEVVRHPNITKCLEMLHSNSRLFLVMEFAGSQNIEHMLRGRTQQRMNESEVNNCFEQVVRGVAHLHSKNIAHRNICLQHLILSTLAGSDREHVQIVDFQSAMLVKPNMTSRTVCGTMPYMAPEMATGGPYWPHSANAWSCGVALLEMAGGLGSLRAAVKFDPEAAAESIAPTLMHFFEDPVSHSEALAVIDGVDTITVIEQLEQLLVPSWADRIVLKNLLPENQPGAEQELLQHEQQRLLEQQQQQQLLQMMQMGQVPQGQALPAPGQLGQMGRPILQQAPQPQ